MSDLEIGEIKYRTIKLPVFEQAHIARKVMPVVMGMGEGFAMAAQRSAQMNGGGDNEDAQNEIMFAAFKPIADVLSAMKDEDFDYVLKKCLSAVMRHNGTSYVPVMRGNALMFDDIDLPTLTQLMMEVIQDNLGPTFLGLMVPGSAGASPSLSNGQA